MESHTVIMDLKNQHIKDYGYSLLKHILKLFFFTQAEDYSVIYIESKVAGIGYLKKIGYFKKIPIENHST